MLFVDELIGIQKEAIAKNLEPIEQIKSQLLEAASQGKEHAIVTCTTPVIFNELVKLGFGVAQISNDKIEVIWVSENRPMAFYNSVRTTWMDFLTKEKIEDIKGYLREVAAENRTSGKFGLHNLDQVNKSKVHKFFEEQGFCVTCLADHRIEISW